MTLVRRGAPARGDGDAIGGIVGPHHTSFPAWSHTVADLSLVAVPMGRWQTNCVIVADQGTGRGLVVDPGEGAASRIPALVGELDVEVEAILLSHGHLDHTWAAPALADELDVPIHLHPSDRFLWRNPAHSFGVPDDQVLAVLEAQFGLSWSAATTRLVDLTDGQAITAAGQRITVTHTPGHTPGSVTFLLHDVLGADVAVAVGRDQAASNDVLLSGDLLFAGSIGRTDFPRGSMDDMMASLRRHLPTMAQDTLVLSGHGPDTTVGAELATNPYVREALASAQ